MTKIICPHCRGSGFVVRDDEIRARAMRLAQRAGEMGVPTLTGKELALHHPAGLYVDRCGAAQLLGLSPRTLKNTARTTGPAFTVARRSAMYALEDLAEWTLDRRDDE